MSEKQSVAIGVYVCHCGTNIAGTVDVEAVAAAMRAEPGVVLAKDYKFMCSDPGQEMVRKDIEEHHLDRLVVAACSPLMHEKTFRKAAAAAGLDPYLVQMANIREHCSWVTRDKTQATPKAIAATRAAVSRVRWMQPLPINTAPVERSAMVIGGGVAGIQTSLDIADAGYKVTLIERAEKLGGHVARFDRVFPTMESAEAILGPKVAEVLHHPRIEVLTRHEAFEVTGSVGNFTIKVKDLDANGGGQPREFKTGAIILATGYDMYDLSALSQFGYGRYPDVLTGLEFEDMSRADGPTGGKIVKKNGEEPTAVAILHCIGSRDENHCGHCSRVCCMSALKHAAVIREKTSAQTYNFYIDMRCFGKGYEEFYRKVSGEGGRFIRGKVGTVTDMTNPELEEPEGSLIVIAEDTHLGRLMRVPVDMVILAGAMTPSETATRVRGMLRISKSTDGFYQERHPKLAPTETATDGIFLCGTCQGPKDIPETISQASGAASAALRLLSHGEVELEPAVAVVTAAMCTGCKMCIGVCAYSAVGFNERWNIAEINPSLCKGCGTCAATCRANAIEAKHFTDRQIINELCGLLAER
jgi:heterodisulfide reductase subunit A